MSKEAVKSLIDRIPDADIMTIYNVVVRFVPEETPTQDEINALRLANEDHSGLIPHEAIDWT